MGIELNTIINLAGGFFFLVVVPWIFAFNVYTVTVNHNFGTNIEISDGYERKRLHTSRIILSKRKIRKLIRDQWEEVRWFDIISIKITES